MKLHEIMLWRAQGGNAGPRAQIAEYAQIEFPLTEFPLTLGESIDRQTSGLEKLMSILK